MSHRLRLSRPLLLVIASVAIAACAALALRDDERPGGDSGFLADLYNWLFQESVPIEPAVKKSASPVVTKKL